MGKNASPTIPSKGNRRFHRTSYVGLASLRLNQFRIEEWVADGGHFVPAADVVRRAPRSVENFRRLWPCADRLWLFDNSGLAGFRCLREEKSGAVVFQTEKLPWWAAELLEEPC